MGCGGEALLLLHPHEEAYVEFLRLNQQVLLQSRPRQACSGSVVSKVKKMAAKDRWAWPGLCASCSHKLQLCHSFVFARPSISVSLCASVCVQSAVREGSARLRLLCPILWQARVWPAVSGQR